MTSIKQIWNNQKLRCGGFYELAIEVSSNQETEPVRQLVKRLFQFDFVKGPFNNEFEKTELDLKYIDNLGYIEIEGKQVPFKTFNVPEEGEGGSNWLDIVVYTAIYEKVLGKEYQTWATNGRWHKGFDECLMKILKGLNAIYQIRMGLIGFEVSGGYYLQTLKEKELTEGDVSHTKFFVNKGIKLKGRNWELVAEI